jgi:hypothetical protein
LGDTATRYSYSTHLLPSAFLRPVLKVSLLSRTLIYYHYNGSVYVLVREIANTKLHYNVFVQEEPGGLMNARRMNSSRQHLVSKCVSNMMLTRK